MTIPDLSGLITKADVNHINMGSHQIDYISWAKTTQILKQHAPGWEFNLRMSESSNYVWAAPNGTGFFVCYFTGPENQQTADFPYPIMNHKNHPVAFKDISSRILTDNHRRAYCACSCFTFALAHEMWSQEEVQETVLNNNVTNTQPLQVVKTEPKESDIHNGFGERLDQSEKGTFIALIKAFNKEHPDLTKWLIETFDNKFLRSKNITYEKYWSRNLLFKPHAEFIAQVIDDKTKELKKVPF